MKCLIEQFLIEKMGKLILEKKVPGKNSMKQIAIELIILTAKSP